MSYWDKDLIKMGQILTCVQGDAEQKRGIAGMSLCYIAGGFLA